MEHNNEIVLTSVRDLNTFLKEQCNEKTIVSIVLEPVSGNVIGDDGNG